MNANKNIKETFDFFREQLTGYYDIHEINSMLYILFEEYLQINKTDILLYPEKNISVSQYSKISKAIEDLKNYRPLQYITAKAYFLGMEFIVGPGILIPRPETEELVQWIIDDHLGSDEIEILDIGSSSGCVTICLDKFIDGSKVFGIDINEGSLDVARKNNEINKTNVGFSLFDICNEAGWDQFQKFDIIVSNPPYVRESEKVFMSRNVLNHEPPEALFVSDDDPLVFYKEILKFSQSHLKTSGKIYFEINEAFGREMVALLEDKGFDDVVLRKDINGRDRFVRGKMVF